MPAHAIVKLNPGDDAHDLESLTEAYLDLCNDPENFRFLTYTFKPFDRETLTGWFSSHKRSGIEYLAARDGKGRISALCAVKSGLVGGFELITMVVRKESRRRGIAAELLARTVAEAAAQGFRAVDVSVYADNKPMLSLLVKRDFVPVRMIHHARADGGDIVVLRRQVAGSAAPRKSAKRKRRVRSR